MATNHYFNNIRASNEQNLVEDLVIESIKIHGQDVLYLPRTVVNKHSLFGEDPLSAFRSSKTIEMFMENVQGFAGAGDVIGKWGLEIQDNASFTVSKKRFQKETGMVRPLEGDLIYYPITKGFFEIKYVEHESPFFQLGKNYVFKLSTELFQFNEETFETGEPEVDAIADTAQFRLFLTYGSTGSSSTGFSVGETVYQYKNGATGGGATSADATGVVKEISGNVLGISNLVGSWLPSSATVNRYVISTNSAAYRIVTGTNDSVLEDTFDDNKDIQTRSDEDLDFTITNPFGTP
jgi:hypothetical protein